MTDPADVITLLSWTSQKMGINYRAIDVDFAHFSFDPRELPTLLLAGHNKFELNDEVRQKLARFVMDGGTILGDACCGWNDFADSFRREIEAIFPGRPLRKLLPEDPVYSSYYKLGNLSYKRGDGSLFTEPPCLEGIDFGCRTGVIFSPRDLTCGWDGHEHPRGTRVLIDEARQVGANLITYILGTFQLGRFLSTTKVYYEAAAPSRDDLVFAQLMHDGDWDPDPSAVHNLLKYVRDHSTMGVKFKRANVTLKDPKVADYPLIYATGHRDFVWSAEEAAALGRYLKAGGLLLADACCGRLAFDAAFRRELAKALPGQQLERLPADHPLYHAHYDIKQVELHAAGARGFRPARGPGIGRHQHRGPAGGHLQPLRPGQRLGAVPPRLQLRAEGRIGVADRHERVGFRGDALKGKASMSPAADSVIQRLDAARQKWWFFSLLTTTVLAACVSFGLFLAFMLADSLLGFSQWMLLGLFLVWLLVTMAILGGVGRRLLRGQRSLEAAARRVEAEFPEAGQQPDQRRPAFRGSQEHRPGVLRSGGRPGGGRDRARAVRPGPREGIALAALPLLHAHAPRSGRIVRHPGHAAGGRHRRRDPGSHLELRGIAIARPLDIRALGRIGRRSSSVTPGNTDVLVGDSVEIAAEIKNPDGKPHRATLWVTPEKEAESPVAMTADEKHTHYRQTVPSVLKPLRVPAGNRRFANAGLRGRRAGETGGRERRGDVPLSGLSGPQGRNPEPEGLGPRGARSTRWPNCGCGSLPR